jgi:predicted DNA-binding protein (UPF0251 family)
MPRKQRKDIITARREEVWRLRTVEDLSQYQIAERLDISQTTVFKDLRAVSKVVQERLADVAVTETTVQIEQLQHIISESLKSWRTSLQPTRSKRVRVVTKVLEDAEGTPILDENGNVRTYIESKDETMTTSRSHGNANYLMAAMKAMSDMRKILGIGDTSSPVSAIIANIFANVNVTWEQELRSQGLDPSMVYESIVQEAYKLIGAGAMIIDEPASDIEEGD